MQLNDVRPFAGLIYNSSRVSDVGACLSQPYDVISEAQQEAYYQQNEHNVIRLILGRQFSDDTEQNNRYTRANMTLSEWTTAGVLRTTEPGFWAYEQEYDLEDGPHTTTGLIGVVRLQELDAGRVLPHEKVMKSPVQDRMRLTLATGTQLEPIWSFYDDPDSKVPVPGHPALLEHKDDATGVRHRLWHVDNPDTCSRLSATISARPIYIADGHHRYQTMLNVRDELRQRYPKAGPDAPWEFILMYLVNSACEELTVLPYHRTVHDLPVTLDESFVQRFDKDFSVTRVQGDDDQEVRHRWHAEIRKGDRFGVVLQGLDGYFVLHRPAEPGRLDVDILNDLILGRALGITEEDMANQSCVAYTHSMEEAVSLARSGSMQMAFVLNATTVAEIVERANGSGVMPRKSSFFYPKPLSGLVFYPMRSDG